MVGGWWLVVGGGGDFRLKNQRFLIAEVRSSTGLAASSLHKSEIM